jgi:hypothetical protein
VANRNLVCIDLLVVACQHDHGELDFDDPRRSMEAVETAAQRLIGTDAYCQDSNVAALAMMAANLLRCAVGEDDLDRVPELLAQQRAMWSRYGEARPGK